MDGYPVSVGNLPQLTFHVLRGTGAHHHEKAGPWHAYGLQPVGDPEMPPLVVLLEETWRVEYVVLKVDAGEITVDKRI